MIAAELAGSGTTEVVDGAIASMIKGPKKGRLKRLR